MKLNKIYQGNCLDILKTFPDNSIDACITDPPYGLSDHKPDDVLFILKEWLNGNDSLIPNKKGFMGKVWDAFVPPPAVWKEVLRVLKPGAHCLVFAGTRTVDLMGISLRLGGFEIRDEIVWCYGSGFPKSLDIGKAVDQIIGNERISIGISTNGIAGGTKELIRGNKNSVGYKKEFVITKGNSEWEGWGTALKPAIEPIIVARKPLEKGLNVAENCLKWGTGGLNVDECRIKLFDGSKREHKNKYRPSSAIQMYAQGEYEKPNWYENPQGRFPANLIIDGSEEVEKLFPETKQSRRSKKGIKSKGYSAGIEWKRAGEETNTIRGYDDNGGSASRFFYKAEFSEDDFIPLFYCPKASKSERNMGLKGMPQKSIREEEGNPDNWDLSEGKVRARMVTKPQANFHPTVKPLALIEYLVKLITRKNQIVLDPFIGSGTTGMACKKLGMNYIGIELNPDYIKISENRIKSMVVQSNLLD